MKDRFWILALIAISFTGCYTSFSPRDYEDEAYGQMNNSYYDSAYVAENNDSTEYYYPEDGYYEEPSEGLTIINNYESSDWDLFPPMFTSASFCGFGYSSYYDPFYDPYYYPSYYPYYNPYYGGNVFVYGDAYFGGYYGGFSPSPIRYRNTSHLYANIRNSGGRGVVTRGRTNKSISRTRESNKGNRFETVRGYDLDKDLSVSRIATTSRSSNSGKLRNASIRTRDNGSKVKRVTDLERRRIDGNSRTSLRTTRKVVTKDKRTRRVSNPQHVTRKKSNSSSRSKRVYSNHSSSSKSSSSYYKPQRSKSSSSRNKSSVSNNSRNHRSSSYNSSRSSSRSSSSHSSYTPSSRSSSSRSSVSRPSSRSSNSPRSTSRSSSRRR